MAFALQRGPLLAFLPSRLASIGNSLPYRVSFLLLIPARLYFRADEHPGIESQEPARFFFLRE